MDKTATRNIFTNILQIHKNLRRSPESYLLLIFNLFVLALVILLPSNRYLVIAAYFFETLVIGMFNVVKMLIITFFSPTRKETPNPQPYLPKSPGNSSPLRMNLFLVVFFILHFGIFYFVQLGLLTGVADMLDDNFPMKGSFFPNPFGFFTAAFGEQAAYTIYVILLVQLFSLLYGFIYKGEYRAEQYIHP